MTLPPANCTYGTTCTYDNLAKWAHENKYNVSGVQMAGEVSRLLPRAAKWAFQMKKKIMFCASQKFKPVSKIKRNSINNCDFF
jgi:hypothetical protein